MTDTAQDRTPEGALVVGTHFSINDLPGVPFNWDPEEAQDFLCDIGPRLRDAMISAGNEFLQNAVSTTLDFDGEWDTFQGSENSARGLKILRLEDKAWMKLNPAWLAKPGEPREVWVAGPEDATVLGAQEAATMSLPIGCVLVQDGTNPFTS